VKYQFVLQFEASSMQDFDRLVALEDSLIEEMGNIAKVDGHDFGSGKGLFEIASGSLFQNF
jgi:hypothetical protein